MYKIGILAYGSLIDNPRKEIEPLIIDRIECTTPFKVEYLRKSRTRSFAPTLIPSKNIGENVKAVVLLLNNDTDLNIAKSILWRRETGNLESGKEYKHSNNPSVNKVQIYTTHEIEGVKTVLYTSIGKNIGGTVTPEKLADLAIDSILNEAGSKKMDGIRYLLANRKNGIVTELSEEYEKLILKKTDCKTLEESIIKMDKKRKSLHISRV